MDTKKFFVILCCLIPGFGRAQSSGPLFQFSFSGYVNAEFFFDSRQMISAREGSVPLFPARVQKDPDGQDLNAVHSTTFSLLSSRLQAGITGPEVFGARSSALVEVDFMGTGQDKFNLIRMRHALIRLNWENTELLAGQYWHPLFVVQCYPGVVAFGSGVPFHVLNRGPQLRLTHKTGALSLTAVLITQSDFASPGPAGTGSAYIRNSGRPEVFGQVILETRGFLAGASLGYLWLRPRTTTSLGYLTNETMDGFSGNLFAKWQGSAASIKLQAIYGENMAHLVMLGGYGEAAMTDPGKNIFSYAGIRNLSVWSDLETNTQPFRAGLFAGFSKNPGSETSLTGASWARGSDIAYMFRISPRIGLFYGKASFNLELLYDVAAYGSPDETFQFGETETADNVRALATIKYGF
ncbi:MAG: hypothetical protein R6U86_01800 [Bacteroidales bacterium]